MKKSQLKEKRNKNDKNAGITLIALVITIIVLLLLAGISIMMLSGNNGILQRAGEAKNVTDEAQIKEQIKLSYLAALSEDLNNVTLKTINEQLKNNGVKGKATKAGKKLKITVDDEKNLGSTKSYIINDSGEISEYKQAEPTEVYVVIYADGEMQFSATKGYKDPEKTGTLIYDGSEKDISNTRFVGLDYTTFKYDIPWYDYANKIKKVTIKEKIVPKFTRMWFEMCRNLKTIDGIELLDTSNVIDMSRMFSGCQKLIDVDASNFDTSNVINMAGMFNYCKSLTSLDVSNFDTSNVTTMSEMFNSCESLTSLDLSNFDTSNVTNMGYMFDYCLSLSKLDVSSFNTSKVSNMANMFYSLKNLQTLDLSHFDTSNVTSMFMMFSFCEKLTSLNISNFKTSNVINMGVMFQCCYNLEQLDVSSFDTSKVTNMQSMFWQCKKLTSLDINNFDTGNVTNMNGMFALTNLEKIYVSDKWSTAKVTDSTNMFATSPMIVNGKSYEYEGVNTPILKGGNGTEWNAEHIDAEYARIDKEGTPGYFTLKN